jgi:hypothetical protein
MSAFRPFLIASAALALAIYGCAALEPRSEAPPTTTEAKIAAATPTAFTGNENSLKFAVLGDFGTGDSGQYRMADRMVQIHKSFPFELVVLVGDNIYGSDRPQDYRRKFETPYKPLLDAGVKFYGALGNHDAREQRFYKLFNMDGKLYYSFKAPKQSVRFFALESTYMQPDQVKWLGDSLAAAGEDWKIVFQHHPLYSSGVTHGSDMRLRSVLEPLLIKNGVKVMLTGHDHLYERTNPQHDITHFVAGAGGKLRPGDYVPNQPFSARVFDRQNSFIAMEILDDLLVFNAIAADGTIIDSGRILRVAPKPGELPAAAPEQPATPPKAPGTDRPTTPPKPTTDKPPTEKPAPKPATPSPPSGRGQAQ